MCEVVYSFGNKEEVSTSHLITNSNRLMPIKLILIGKVDTFVFTFLWRCQVSQVEKKIYT